MTNFFKKTLVAAAVATAAMSVNAAEFTFSTVGVSKEGVQGVTTFSLGSAISLKLDAEYSQGDIIKFVVNGDAADKDAWPAALTVNAVQKGGTQLAGGSGETATVSKKLVLGRLSGTAAGATYRVTQVTDPVDGDTVVSTDGTNQTIEAGDTITVQNTTIGVSVVLADGEIELRSAKAVEAGIVSLAFAAETQTGVSLDTADTVELTVAGDEFVRSSTTVLDGEIQIEKARKQFDTSNATDTFTVVTAERTKAFRNAADATGVTFLAGTEATDTGIELSLKGNFSFVPDFDDAGDYVSATGCTLDSVAAGEIVATHTAVGSCAIELDIGGGFSSAPVAIEPQDFTYSYTVTYDDQGGNERTKALVTNGNAGEWVLNSYSTTIGYMPYGAGITQIIYVANTSTTAGKVFADAWLADGTKVLADVEVGSLVANGQTEVSTKLAQALAAKGVTSDRVRVRLVAEVPTGEARTFSAYNVNGDRLATGNN